MNWQLEASMTLAPAHFISATLTAGTNNSPVLPSSSSCGCGTHIANPIQHLRTWCTACCCASMHVHSSTALPSQQPSQGGGPVRTVGYSLASTLPHPATMYIHKSKSAKADNGEARAGLHPLTLAHPGKHRLEAVICCFPAGTVSP